MIHRATFLVSDFQSDCHGNLKLSSLLGFVQEAAGQHCTLLGVDGKSLEEKNLLWAITRHKVVIHRLPKRGETVTVQTWPMPTTRVAFPRSFAAYDEKGNLLFQGISIWINMDATTRKMVLPGKSGLKVEGTLLGSELETPHAITPHQWENTTTRCVTYSCLDRNGHMNNTRYFDWVDDLLSCQFHADHTPKEFAVCYFKEGIEGQQISLNWALTEDMCLHVDAHRQDPNTPENTTSVFSATVQF